MQILPQTQIFKIPIYLQHNGVNLWYFNLTLFDPTKFIVWNIKDLQIFGVGEID